MSAARRIIPYLNIPYIPAVPGHCCPGLAEPHHSWLLRKEQDFPRQIINRKGRAWGAAAHKQHAHLMVHFSSGVTRTGKQLVPHLEVDAASSPLHSPPVQNTAQEIRILGEEDPFCSSAHQHLLPTPLDQLIPTTCLLNSGNWTGVSHCLPGPFHKLHFSTC